MEPLLLTPGPLTTAPETRAAMARDWGSRDPRFVALVGRVCAALEGLVEDARYAAVPLQGSGTFAVESMIGSLVPPEGKLLVCVNGAYGKRMVAIAGRLGRSVEALEHAEIEPVDVARLEACLAQDPTVTHVAVVHCETTTGLLNPIEEVARVVQAQGRALLIDAMSALGALPLRGQDVAFEAVAGSANKCLEGVPGLAFVLATEAALGASEGYAHSVSLDLHAQWARLCKDGQFRFTPPTHVLAALDAALAQHASDGGVAGRGARYEDNRRCLVEGLRALGLQTLLPDALQAPIIVTVLSPPDRRWDFGEVYAALVDRGFAIYPGKLTEMDTFRVGCIGQVYASDIERFLSALGQILDERGVVDRAPRAPWEGA